MESRPAWAGRTVGKRGLSRVDRRVGRPSVRFDDGARTRAFWGRHAGWGGDAPGPMPLAHPTARGRARRDGRAPHDLSGQTSTRVISSLATLSDLDKLTKLDINGARCPGRWPKGPASERGRGRSVLLDNPSLPDPESRLRRGPGKARDEEVRSAVTALNLVHQPARHPTTTRPGMPPVRGFTLLGGGPPT